MEGVVGPLAPGEEGRRGVKREEIRDKYIYEEISVCVCVCVCVRARARACVCVLA